MKRNLENSPELIKRFDSLERLVHWLSAFFTLTCIFTALALKFPQLMVALGGRTPLRIVHIFSGILMPIPIVFGMLLPKKGAHLRKDIKTLNLWDKGDKKWLRSWGSAKSLWPGKFNGGQKANASFSAGMMLVMLMTGTVMATYNLFPLPWRQGATFVHNLLALFAIIIIGGHISYALMEPASLKSMLSGSTTRAWAKKHSPAWVDEIDETDTKPPSSEAEFLNSIDLDKLIEASHKKGK